MNDVYENSLLTAVIYNEHDASRFLKDRPEVDRLLPLTPDALAVLSDVDLPRLNTLDLYTDYGHRRVIARARRMERKLWLALEKDCQLSPAVRETLWGMIHFMFSPILRLWYSLRNVGGSFLLLEKNGWQRYDCLEDAHSTLLYRISSYSVFQKTFWKIPYLSGLVCWINKIICQIAKEKNVLMLTSGNAYGFPNLILHAKQQFPELNIITVRGSRGNWIDLLVSIKNFLKVLKKNNNFVTLTAIPTPSPVVEKRVKDLLSLIEDPVLQKGINIYYDYLIENLALTEGLKNEVEQLWERLRPKLLIAHTLRWWSDAVLGDVAKQSNTPSFLISHGSHPKFDSAAAAYEHQFLSQGMLVSPLASKCLLQSPQAELGAAQYGPKISTQLSRPIMWAYRNFPIVPIQSKFRYILHASTFKSFHAHRPWIYETSDEYVHGLKLLILACQNLKNTKLFIRIRPQAECNLSTLKKLLPKSEQYEIITSGEFLEDLSRADLLVSFSSTTIEEALYARRPVLLWGGTQRHQHLPARTTYPSENSRSAVYATKSEKELTPLLSAILDAHAGKPLDDAELKNYVWPENETIPSIKELLLEHIK